MKPIFAFLLGMMVCGAIPSELHAQAGTPASAGVYTTQQAGRGKTLYDSKCSTCHGADLSGGGTSPALAGPDFTEPWTNGPMSALFSVIHSTMPADQPGTLTAQQTADVIAFLLSSNKFPAGQTELPTDTDHLKNILFDKAPAAPAN